MFVFADHHCSGQRLKRLVLAERLAGDEVLYFDEIEVAAEGDGVDGGGSTETAEPSTEAMQYARGDGGIVFEKGSTEGEALAGQELNASDFGSMKEKAIGDMQGGFMAGAAIGFTEQGIEDGMMPGMKVNDTSRVKHPANPVKRRRR